LVSESDLEAALDFVRARAAGSVEGIFGPASMTWRLKPQKKIGSSWNRVGKFEGLKGRKARYFRDLLHFCRVQNLAQMLDGKDIETSSAALGYVFI
jgi:hypothetical protein